MQSKTTICFPQENIALESLLFQKEAQMRF